MKYKSGKKAPAVYEREGPLQEWVEEQTGCVGVRNPVVYFMELADDISYIASDIEDALKYGILSSEDLADLVRKSGADEVFFDRGWARIDSMAKFLKQRDKRHCWQEVKSVVTKGLLVYAVKFLKEYLASARPSEWPEVLTKVSPMSGPIDDRSRWPGKIKTKVYNENILKSPALEVARAQCATVLRRLWECLESTACRRKRATSWEPLLPDEYREALKISGSEEERFEIITDFIAGMTDRYALRMYHETMVLSGAILE